MSRLMKTANIFFVMAFLSGCVRSNNTTTASPSDPANPPISLTSIPSLVPTLTSTPVPILPADEVYARVREFLKNGPDCQLPCWLGITPGKSSVADVQAQLTTFSGIAKDIFIGKVGKSWSLGTLELNYPEENEVINIYSTYLVSFGEDRIMVIGVDTQALPQSLAGLIYGDLKYSELLSAYTLPQMLFTYGIPAQIFFTADIYEYERDAPDFFEIRLLYPEMGIFAIYTMPAETTANTYRFCPSNSFIKLTLIPQDLGDSYQELLLKLGDEWYGFFPLSSFHKTPEEAIGTSIEDFYGIFSSSANECLESPKSIWPER